MISCYPDILWRMEKIRKNKKKNKVGFFVRMPPELILQFKLKCLKEGVSCADIVEKKVKEYIYGAST